MLELSFEKYYPYDISVITDDNPFFYKYYKLGSFNPLHTLRGPSHGPCYFSDTDPDPFASGYLHYFIYFYPSVDR